MKKGLKPTLDNGHLELRFAPLVLNVVLREALASLAVSSLARRVSRRVHPGSSSGHLNRLKREERERREAAAD